jgi:hypothetical protein
MPTRKESPHSEVAEGTAMENMIFCSIESKPSAHWSWTNQRPMIAVSPACDGRTHAATVTRLIANDARAGTVTSAPT